MKRKLPPEVLAGISGPLLGRRYGRDPFACARGLGIAVQYATLQGCDGRYFGGLDPPMIEVAHSLSGYQLSRVVAHELGHHVLGPDATEGDCDSFARFFLNARLPETPRERWGRWQREAQEAERRRAAASAGAR